MMITNDVTKFIDEFMPVDKQAYEIIRSKFRAGYCYHFAEMLKATFNRGTVCLEYPFAHIVWVDRDGIPYDVEGVLLDSEAKYFIPIELMGDAIYDFKHIDGLDFNASKEEVKDVEYNYIEKYINPTKNTVNRFIEICEECGVNSDHKYLNILRNLNYNRMHFLILDYIKSTLNNIYNIRMIREKVHVTALSKIILNLIMDINSLYYYNIETNEYSDKLNPFIHD